MYSIRQRFLAEVLGTAALLLVGPGSVIAPLPLAGKAVPAVTEADLLGISVASGCIITALVYAIGKVAISRGSTFWEQYIPVYLIPGLVGAALAAFAYDYRANPRHVDQPIEDAVSHEEAPAQVAAAH